MTLTIYFQVHQPYRLRTYRVFDIGTKHDYFDETANKMIMKKVANNCYVPVTALIQKMLKNHRFKVAFSITGTAIEQMQAYSPQALALFKTIAKHHNVELLAETYHHNLSALFDANEFQEEVALHAALVKKTFGVTPTTFRNTELIYDDRIAAAAKKLGYSTILADGMKTKNANAVYKSPAGVTLLLKNAKRSDDIAFHYSPKLTPAAFAKAIAKEKGNVNLFMDYETFGEHINKNTGILRFLEQLPAALEKRKVSLMLPREHRGTTKLSVKQTTSWADEERDTSAWLGNTMQQTAMKKLYSLLPAARKQKKMDTWRKLSTSDHPYYMSTKRFNDQAVHDYFSPYDSPYDAFINYMNVLKDFSEVMA